MPIPASKRGSGAPASGLNSRQPFGGLGVAFAVLVSSLRSRLVFLHLLAIAAALLLTSCEDSISTPVKGEGQRAGADLVVRAGASLPSSVRDSTMGL